MATYSTPLTAELAGLLADTIAMSLRTQAAHWNVTGSNFPQYHKLFRKVYEDVAESVDPMAENLRKLDAFAPCCLADFAAMSTPAPMPAATDCETLAADLLIANEALLARIAVVFDLATADGEQGLANFAADRMDMHKRWSWQLRASLTEEIYAEDMLEPAQAMAPMEEDMAEPMPMRSAFPDFEARRGLLATAERFTAEAEVRATTMTDGQVKIAGYAATFMREATGLPFREQIAPGAFSRSLQSAEPVFLLVNHDTDALPLASTGSGTLQLREDSKGLYMEAALDPANPQAAALISATSRGDVSKMSFSFTVNDGGEKREDGLRTLTDLTLYEVSCVTWPAYSDTTVGMRSADAEQDVALRAKRAQLKQRQINNRTK